MSKTVFKKGLIFLIAVLFLLGCARPTQEPASDEAAAPAPFAADYALVWEILENDYPYLDYLRDKGIRVDSIRERYAERVNNVKQAKSFSEILNQMFGELEFTAHLFVINPEFFREWYTIYVLSPDVKESLFFQPWREILIKAAESEQYSVPKNAENGEPVQPKDRPKVKVTYFEDCKTLCLKIPTFLFDTVERDRDLLQTSLEQYPETENIIFDLTGNSGGSTEYWYENLVAPFGEDHTFRWRVFYKDTPENKRIVENMFDLCNTSEAADAPEWAIRYGLNRYICMEHFVQGREAVHSDAKRWVLVNSDVYSSSEEFVVFCKLTGWATVVGAQTWGDGMGFSPVLRYLPDSGLLFEFDMTAGENPDGTMNIEGTTPDIVLDTVDVDHLLELIRQEQTD